MRVKSPELRQPQRSPLGRGRRNFGSPPRTEPVRCAQIAEKSKQYFPVNTSVATCAKLYQILLPLCSARQEPKLESLFQPEMMARVVTTVRGSAVQQLETRALQSCFRSTRTLRDDRELVKLDRDAIHGSSLHSNDSAPYLQRTCLGWKGQRQFDLGPVFEDRFGVEEDTACAQVSTDSRELEVPLAVISNGHRLLGGNTLRFAALRVVHVRSWGRISGFATH